MTHRAPRQVLAPLILVTLASLTGLASASEEQDIRGLLVSEPDANPGFTMISPFSNGTTYVLDLEGRVVKTWESLYEPGLAPYLLPNGNLLRGIQLHLPVRFDEGGSAGGVQEFSWDGELLWEYHFAGETFFHHHDIEPLPNGNLLMVAWEYHTQEQALGAGRRPDHAGEEGFWPGFIVEIEPLRPYGARVVWEWHVWDHLIQDEDPSLPDYGVVAEHPERIDINGDIPREETGAEAAAVSDEERAQLIAMGYLDEDTGPDLEGDHDNGHDDNDEEDDQRGDWLHINGMDYNAELDQIVVSMWHMNEIWVIDHGTTTREARGSQGGRAGRGGDLLYRWGNPQTWQQGREADRRLFHQHDPQWIPAGFPGAGNITIFNNGRHRPDEEYSSVVEITPPLQPDGTYARQSGAAFGPMEPTWEYVPPEDDRFYASFISGAQRLANGNTLVCSGPHGRVFEVTPAGATVWEHSNPFGKLEHDGTPGRFTYGMFRATRLAPDHPGLRGRDLLPLDPQPLTALEEHALLPEPGEKPSGWQPLFDEELRLSQWVDVNCAIGRTFEMTEDPDDEESQILRCTGLPTGIMRSKEMYENFIVEFEWRHMDDPGNAGLFLWADPLPALGGPFTRGIEVQICNLGNGTWFTSHGDIFPIWGAVMTPDPRFRISGSRSMPNEDAFHGRPTGEWNHYRITAIDGAITLEVNGHLVAAGTACSPSKGFLCLESEGGEVHFRDMQIWELPAGSHAADAASTAQQAGDHVPLYNGLDLEDWNAVRGDWEPQDWHFSCTDAPAELSIELPEDFRSVLLDFKREVSATDALLPFSLAGQRFAATGETAAEWNRISITRSGNHLQVGFGGSQHTRTVTWAGTPALTLLNDGLATGFCSLFVEAGR